MFRLLGVRMQREEKSPQVWSAVLGCLLHLVTHCGYVVRGYLQGLPLRVLAALMQCCLHHHWCHATYCHLVRLAVNLMYVPASPNLDSGEETLPPQCHEPIGWMTFLHRSPTYGTDCWFTKRQQNVDMTRVFQDRHVAVYVKALDDFAFLKYPLQTALQTSLPDTSYRPLLSCKLMNCDAGL